MTDFSKSPEFIGHVLYRHFRMRNVAIIALVTLVMIFAFLRTNELGETELSEAPDSLRQIEVTPTFQSATFAADADNDAVTQFEVGISTDPYETPGASVAPPTVSPVLMKSAEAAFAEEHEDQEWSSRMWREMIETINVIEGGVSNAEINCRSSTCRVELVWGRTVTDEGQYLERIAAWEKGVLALGEFRSGRSEFFPESATSLSYFSKKGLTEVVSSGLPPEIPLEFRMSFRQALREGAEEVRRQAAEASAASSETEE